MATRLAVRADGFTATGRRARHRVRDVRDAAPDWPAERDRTLARAREDDGWVSAMSAADEEYEGVRVPGRWPRLWPVLRVLPFALLPVPVIAGAVLIEAFDTPVPLVWIVMAIPGAFWTGLFLRLALEPLAFRVVTGPEAHAAIASRFAISVEDDRRGARAAVTRTGIRREHGKWWVETRPVADARIAGPGEDPAVVEARREDLERALGALLSAAA